MTPTPSTSNDFSDLDALLTESSAARNLTSARKQLKDTRMTASEQAQINAKVREWETVSEWCPAAITAMFSAQVCTCGSSNVTFQGVFQRQEHRRNRLSRWIKETAPAHLNLPKERKCSGEWVAMCWECTEGQGYEATSPAGSAFPLSRMPSRY